jgi:glycosyltransferase involved in cell wall biosynthesis
MYKPVFSIIITVLNGAETIGTCLNSIEQQTFSDYEVIIVDGGSADHTMSIANESLITNKKIFIVPGLGLYAGLNMGVDMAVGDWLYFLGCDDLLYRSDTLQQVATYVESAGRDAKVLVGRVDCIKQDNLLRPKFGSPYWMRYQVHHQGMFYYRSVFANNNRYDESRRIASDYEFNLKLALANIPHQGIDLTICSFGGDGLSENQMDRGAAEMQQIHKQLFSGVARYWAMGYFRVQRQVLTIRKRLNLVNLKVRFRRFLKRGLPVV